MYLMLATIIMVRNMEIISNHMKNSFSNFYIQEKVELSRVAPETRAKTNQQRLQRDPKKNSSMTRTVKT